MVKFIDFSQTGDNTGFWPSSFLGEYLEVLVSLQNIFSSPVGDLWLRTCNNMFQLRYLRKKPITIQLFWIKQTIQWLWLGLLLLTLPQINVNCKLREKQPTYSILLSESTWLKPLQTSQKRNSSVSPCFINPLLAARHTCEICSARETLTKAESLPGESGIVAGGRYNLFCPVGNVCYIYVHMVCFQQNVLPRHSFYLGYHIFCLEAVFF